MLLPIVSFRRETWVRKVAPWIRTLAATAETEFSLWPTHKGRRDKL